MIKQISIIGFMLFLSINGIGQTQPDSSFCRIYSNLSDYWHTDTVCVGDTIELYWIPGRSFPDDTRFFVRWFPDLLHNPPIFRIVSDTYQTFDTTIPGYPVRGKFVFDLPTSDLLLSVSRCGPSSDTTANCQLLKAFYVRACPPEARISGLKEICTGECISYQNSSKHKVISAQWTFEGGSPSSYTGISPPSVCYATAGIYTTKLVVSNLSGVDSMLTTVRVFDAPQGSPFVDAHTLNSRDTLRLSACVEGLHYKWQPTNGLSCTTCSNPLLTTPRTNTDYTCIVYNGSEKCAILCKYPITVERGNYYIPNTFTPNGDGHNDVFEIFITENISIKQLQIFDRWGELVASPCPSEGGVTSGNCGVPPSFGGVGGGLGFWDGTFRGQGAIQDVYVYVIVLEFADGTTETVTGDVTLLR